MKTKALIIHQGALGDLILSFPALLSFRNDAQVSVALWCAGGLGRLARELNIVDAHFSLESTLFSSVFCDEITSPAKAFINDYDTIILISFSDAIAYHLRQHHGGKVYQIAPRPPADEKTHVALHLMGQFCEKGLIRNRCSACSCLLKTTFVSSRFNKVTPIQERIVVMHPGAGSLRKRWLVENFLRTALEVENDSLGKVVFVLGPAESDLAPVIKEGPAGRFPVCEVSDVCSLPALLKQASCFVGHDSGVTHLAAFMGVPTVAIFGPSSVERWSPVGLATRVLRGSVECSPCFETNGANCNDPRCLTGVSMQMILEAVKELTVSEDRLGGRPTKSAAVK